jgi:glycosyltransferase involved in cell wall biosynthesis
MPLFTIVVPVYRTEQFLAECLASLRDQTCDDFECLVVDDGSPGAAVEGRTLSCATVLHTAVRDDGRFRLLRQANRGQGFARQAGIDRAAGRYLVLVDADDKLAPDFLAIARDRLAARPDDVLYFNRVEVFTPDGTLPFATTQRFVPRENTLLSALVFPSYTLTPVNYFYETDLIRRAGVRYRVAQAGEDTYFFFDYLHALFAARGRLPSLVPIEAVYWYRIDPTAKSTTQTGDFDERLYRHHLDYFGTRAADFDRWGWRYGLLARVFRWRQRVYLTRLQAGRPAWRAGLHVVAKTLTLCALLLSGTRRAGTSEA